jgi:hypothetical protein
MHRGARPAHAHLTAMRQAAAVIQLCCRRGPRPRRRHEGAVGARRRSGDRRRESRIPGRIPLRRTCGSARTGGRELCAGDGSDTRGDRASIRRRRSPDGLLRAGERIQPSVRSHLSSNGGPGASARRFRGRRKERRMTLRVAMIGYGFMGSAHSVGWRNTEAVFPRVRQRNPTSLSGWEVRTLQSRKPPIATGPPSFW